MYLQTYLESANAAPDYIARAMKLFAQYEKELKAEQDALQKQNLENPPIGDSTSEIILGDNDDERTNYTSNNPEN